jgi:hypothetical protein
MRVERLTEDSLDALLKERVQKMADAFIGYQTNFIIPDYEIKMWMRKHSNQSDKLYWIPRSSPTEQQDQDSLEVYTGETDFTQLFQFIDDVPRQNIFLIAPSATLPVKDDMVFKDDSKYAMIVSDMSVDEGFVSSSLYNRLRTSVKYLGVRTAIDIQCWLGYLCECSWQFLRIINITGKVTNKNLSHLLFFIPHIQCIKMNAYEPLNLELFAMMRNLESLAISSPVTVETLTEQHYVVYNQVRRSWILKDLELANCSRLTSHDFDILSDLRKLSLLHLYQSPDLSSHYLSVILENAHQSLTTLNLSYTSACTDALLSGLKSSSVTLFVLRANCPLENEGFTNEAMIVFLKWKQNIYLQVLEVCGHIQLTKDIFRCRAACRNKLEQLDLRDTGCAHDPDHGQLLRLIFKFCRPKKFCEGSECTPDMTGEIVKPMNIHLTYQSGVETVLDSLSVAVGEQKNRRVIVRYWKQTAPEAINVGNILPSSANPYPNITNTPSSGQSEHLPSTFLSDQATGNCDSSSVEQSDSSDDEFIAPARLDLDRYSLAEKTGGHKRELALARIPRWCIFSNPSYDLGSSESIASAAASSISDGESDRPPTMKIDIMKMPEVSLDKEPGSSLDVEMQAEQTRKRKVPIAATLADLIRFQDTPPSKEDSPETAPVTAKQSNTDDSTVGENPADMQFEEAPPAPTSHSALAARADSELRFTFFQPHYPVHMFTAPGMVTDYCANGITTACTVPTADPQEVKWELQHAQALCD